MSLHPLALGLGTLIRKIYPLQGNPMEFMEGFESSASVWAVLCLFAILPGICEELAFRGFILSGLRHTGSKWRAIAISSVLFGVAHGVIQQSILATFIGIFLAYITIQSGSILPSMICHACYNGLTVLSFVWIPKLIERFPRTEGLFEQVHDLGLGDEASYIYRWPVIVVSALLSYALLCWFRSLPFKPSAEERLRDALDRQVAFQNSLHRTHR